MESIILIVVVIILTVILFFSLKALISSIETESENMYYKMVRNYDTKKEVYLPCNDIEDLKIIHYEEKENVIDDSFAEEIRNTDYKEENILSNLKNLDDVFRIDDEKVINNFLSTHQIGNHINSVYSDFLKKLNPNVIYNIKSNNDGLSYLKSILDDDEKRVLDEYLLNNKFDIKDLILKLKDYESKYSYVITIYTGDKNKNYNGINNMIKTVYDPKIARGIIIKYKDKLYDYSLNERDV